MSGKMKNSLFVDDAPTPLTADEEAMKREIYEKLNPRRRKFVDRIGYDAWDPFQKPNDPLDLRTDATKRTTQQLVREFLHHAGLNGQYSNDYARGALECALGVVNKEEKYLGIYDFCVWYTELLKKEGITK